MSQHSDVFAERLKSIRKSCKLRQQDLADALGIDRSTYAYYETGKSKPDMFTLCHLAEMFGISVDELLGKQIAPPSVLRDRSPLEAEEIGIGFSALDDEERCLLLQYRQLNDKQKRDLVNRLLGYINEPS